MAIQKTEAFVLRTYPFRSSSLIVTLFSRSFGKLKGIAKGVRNEREVRGALYELFTHLDIVFYEKTRSDLHLISEVAIVESHDGLRSRLDTIAHASYFAELVDVMTEVHDPHENIFLLLDQAFRFLPSIPASKLSRIFEIKLLNEIGWLPYLEGCLHCGQTQPAKCFFSVVQGALLCEKCSTRYEDSKNLSGETVHLLRHFIRREFEEALRFRAGRFAEEELDHLLQNFLSYRLSAPLKTRTFLDSLKQTSL